MADENNSKQEAGTTPKQPNDSNVPKNSKSKKQKGPIRWEAIVPFLIFTTFVWAYFSIFFDSHLRRGLEFAGTYINGAEVNIDDIDTSFWNASLVIRNIQVTSPEKPTTNKVQVGEVRWNVLWDALLRGKIAIEEASILEVGLNTPRKRAGRVLPKDSAAGSAAEKLRTRALEEAQQQLSGNVLGDISALLSGVDPKEQLKNIEASLASSTRIKELQDELKNKEKEWRDRIDRLPKNKDIEAYNTRLKAVKLDGFKNPAEVQASVKEIDSILKDIDSKINEVESTGKAVNTDVGGYRNALNDLQTMIQKDIKDIESRLKIPSLDLKDLAMSLFGPMFLGKVRQVERYMSKAREYMPPKKPTEEKAKYEPPTPRERIAGRNYKFGRPNAYPLFWLKKAQLSSKAASDATNTTTTGSTSAATVSEWSGHLTGTLQNLTDDPSLLSNPLTLTFSGDFPKQNINNLYGEIVVDHRTTTPIETAALRIGSFKIKGQSLVDSKDVQLAFNDANATSEIDIKLQEGTVEIKSATAFDNIDYMIDAENQLFKGILQNILSSVPKVTLNAAASGTWTDLAFNLNSNLGREIQKGFEKELHARITEARAQVKSFVNEKIGAEKAKLQDEYKKIEGQIRGEIAEKQAAITKAKSQLEVAKNKATKEQSKKIESEGKKQLEKMFKGKKLRF